MAAATILLRHGENRAVFSNSIAARLADIGTAWTTVRAGILFQINGDGNIVSPDIALGFSSGTANVYGDATTTHFVGVRNTTNWTANPAVATDFYSSLNMTATKRVGSTITDGGSFAVGAQAYSNAAASPRGTMMFISLTKGSPNYTLRLFFRSSNGGSVHPTEADFLTQMGILASTFTQHSFASNQVLAVDEVADGTLDAFNFYWGPSAQTVEVSAVAVSILA